MAKFKRKLKKAVKSVKKVVDKVLKHASPNTKVGVNVTVPINTGATPVHQSAHNQPFKYKELNAQKKIESKSTEKSKASNTYIFPSGIKMTKLPKIEAAKKTSAISAAKKTNKIADTKKMKVGSSKTTIQKQNKKVSASSTVINTKNENKKTVAAAINQKTPIKLNLPVPSKPSFSNNKNILINNRFVAQQGMVSDRVNRQDYSNKEFARRISQANTILFNHKLNNSYTKYVVSPFSNRNVTMENLRFELSQAILAANNDKKLFEQIKTATIAGMEISGAGLSNHKSGVGLFLSTAAKKLGHISNVADLISVINYASKGDFVNANKVIDNVASGLAGAYLGAQIGAIGAGVGSALGAATGGIMLSNENNRKWIQEQLGFKDNNYKKGEFDYIDIQSLNRQSQTLKQSMANFSPSKTSVIESRNLDSDRYIFLAPSK